jgi:hypothetical protein
VHAYVVITAVLVASSGVAVVAVTARDFISALNKTRALAGMRSVSSGDRVGLPDVHLGAASTNLAGSSVRVGIRGVPALNIGLSVDELNVVGALSIAVSSTELGTGLVVALAHAAVREHLHEVESTIQTARQLGYINVEGEFLANEVEHLVLGVRLHQVGTGSNVGRAGTLGDELEGQSTATGADTVGTCAVSVTIKSFATSNDLPE